MSWRGIVTRGASIVAVNVLVFALLAEGVGVLTFYLQHGWLFYVYPYRPTYSAPVQDQGGAALTTVGLHPFFGPTHRPGIPFDIPPDQREAGANETPVETNNLGFASPFDYPYVKRSPGEYVVGIFGGSVGAWFCQLGSRTLVRALQRDPAFRDTPIVPLCFSHEGYKQPQQLLVLAYALSIGQRFDLVVNIDGFNEVALSPLNEANGFDASMPSATHIQGLVNLVNQSTLTPEKLDALVEVTRERRRLGTLASWLSRTRLASVYVVLEHVYQWSNRRFAAAQMRFAQLPSNPTTNSMIHLTPPVATRTPDALMAAVADGWAESSASMHALASSRGVEYLHVLQPNQYFTTRRFGPDEARVALAEDSSFKASVELGYPMLLKAVQTEVLARAGVHVLDGTRLFDAEPAAVYMDNCCHYTLRGNQILAEAIARAVLEARARRPDGR